MTASKFLAKYSSDYDQTLYFCSINACNLLIPNREGEFNRRPDWDLAGTRGMCFEVESSVGFLSSFSKLKSSLSSNLFSTGQASISLAI